MLTTILESFTRQKQTAEETYASLVLTIASGKPWPKSAVDIAVAAGRSIDDLQRDVTAVLAQSEAEEQLIAADGMQPEIDRLAAELHTAMVDHQALIVRHRRELERSHFSVAEAIAAHQGAVSKQRKLRSRAELQLNSTN